MGRTGTFSLFWPTSQPTSKNQPQGEKMRRIAILFMVLVLTACMPQAAAQPTVDPRQVNVTGTITRTADNRVNLTEEVSVGGAPTSMIVNFFDSKTGSSVFVFSEKSGQSNFDVPEGTQSLNIAVFGCSETGKISIPEKPNIPSQFSFGCVLAKLGP
jgi:hypothetical protein